MSGDSGSDMDQISDFAANNLPLKLMPEVCGLFSRSVYEAPNVSEQSPRDFLKDPLYDAGADAELLADHVDAIPFVPQLQYARFDRWLDAPASQLHAIGPRTGEPCIDPFADDAAFKFRKD